MLVLVSEQKEFFAKTSETAKAAKIAKIAQISTSDWLVIGYFLMI